MHDRIAELRGLRAEHDRHTQSGDSDRAGQVATEITRATGDIDAEIERLEDRAVELAELGQHFPAAERAEAARLLRAGMDELRLPVPAKRGGKQTAVAAAPPETAKGGE